MNFVLLERSVEYESLFCLKNLSPIQLKTVLPYCEFIKVNSNNGCFDKFKNDNEVVSVKTIISNVEFFKRCKEYESFNFIEECCINLDLIDVYKVRNIDIFKDFIQNILLKISFTFYNETLMFPYWSKWQVLCVEQDKYKITKCGVFTSRFDLFCESIANITISFINNLAKYKNPYKIDINTKHKWKKHDCKLVRGGGVLQHLTNNDPAAHEIICTNAFTDDWLVKFVNLLDLNNDCGITSLFTKLNRIDEELDHEQNQLTQVIFKTLINENPAVKSTELLQDEEFQIVDSWNG